MHEFFCDPAAATHAMTTYDCRRIGKVLAKRRVELGYSLEDMATMTGLDPVSIQGLESGEELINCPISFQIIQEAMLYQLRFNPEPKVAS